MSIHDWRRQSAPSPCLRERVLVAIKVTACVLDCSFSLTYRLQIAKALAEIHAANVIHKDINANNVCCRGLFFG